jgi:prepilin-type N-terminal cleavage/methylation domain-containing protein
MFKRKNGFTLIELLIVAAGIGGLALVSITLSKMNLKSSAKFTYDSDVQSIANELSTELSTPSKCATSLGGTNAMASTNTITNIGGKYYIKTDSSAPAGGYGTSNLKIDSYSVSSTASELANDVSYLNVNFVNKDLLRGSSGSTVIPKKIKLKVKVDAAGDITSCTGINTINGDNQEMVQGMCISLGGSWDTTNNLCQPSSGTGNGPLTCPTGSVMVGITHSGVACTALPTSVLNSAGNTIDSPGPGCIGMACETHDFGPCNGQDCKTNGNNCIGMSCTACGPSATCTGMACCGGATCPRCP